MILRHPDKTTSEKEKRRTNCQLIGEVQFSNMRHVFGGIQVQELQTEDLTPNWNLRNSFMYVGVASMSLQTFILSCEGGKMKKNRVEKYIYQTISILK